MIWGAKIIAGCESRKPFCNSVLIEEFKTTVPSLCLRTATGDPTPILGEVIVQINLFGCVDSPHKVFVADIEDEGILGLDFLTAHDCVISTQRNSLPSNSREIPLCSKKRRVNWTPPKVRKVELSEDNHQDLPPPHLGNLFERSSATLNLQQEEFFKSVLFKYADSLAVNSGDNGRCTSVKHKIDVGSNPPIKQAPRRLALNGREKVKKLVEDMLTNDVIEPFSSFWGSPIVLVNKKDGFFYLDDIIVFEKDFEEEVDQLEQVFSRKKSASSAEGVRADPSKIEKVSAWPTPTNKEQVQSFLGLCTYYRRFVKGFATIAKPLHRLTGIKIPFDWTPECQEAFKRLKENLTFSPILAYPEVERPFILDTDASLSGIGGVLSQIQEGQERVISYYSRVLSKPERNYCVTRRELLAVVKTVYNMETLTLFLEGPAKKQQIVGNVLALKNTEILLLQYERFLLEKTFKIEKIST
ncbi:uncharacterized protein LOC124410184 [Diprion similis]|uniref:uncharacterized protein LOC124410184 n=1 Tax=Diprion similis TaxID=362088 RepID=UPI001EF81969|nr:uncharacterized protein LOC124410184 [Diprion similis]